MRMRKHVRFFFIFVFICIFLSALHPHSERNRSQAGLNVLLITIDTLRPDRLSCYSREHLETPNIDSLAEKGILFTKAFAHTSTTFPSHVNILLGTVPLYHGVHDNSTFILEDRFLTLAEHLKAHGYSTGAFIGAFPLDSKFGLAQGFDVYDDDYMGDRYQKYSYVERKAEIVVDRALEWLKEQSAPWFLWIHCWDPHHPYDPPEPFHTQYKEHLYDGEVAYVDSVLGRMFDYIHTNGLAGNTLIVLTGDHGEGLGEHGELTHGYFAYNSTIRIPLIITIPGENKRQVTQLVTHTDIFPTVCDVLRIEKEPFLQGLSLLPAIKGKKLPKRPVYFESLYPYYSRQWAPLRGFIYEEEKYIESPIPEVYDLDKDFHELNNLAGTKKLAGYRKQLADIMKDQSLPEEEGKVERRIDREDLKKLRSLGYISTPQLSMKKNFGPSDDIKVLLPNENKAKEAMSLYREGRIDEAISMLNEVVAERKGADLACTNLAVLYREQGRMKEALELLKGGFEDFPSSYEIFSTYANYLLNVKMYDEVIELIKTNSFRQMEFDPEIWNYLGSAYTGKGDLEKALEAYEAAAAIDDKHHTVYNNLGSTYLLIFIEKRDRMAFQNALQNFKKAIELDPDYASAYNGLGGAYLLAGDLDGAIYCLEKALEIDPDLGRALYNLGLAYLDKGDKARALGLFVSYRDKFSRFISPSEKERLEELIQKCRQK
jgi:arylsulfatase A-like enzyme/Flp pilus assembly protein TadD